MRGLGELNSSDVDPALETLVTDVVDAIVTVRRELGAGLYGRIYERALMIELKRRGRGALARVPHAARYHGEELGLGFRADIIVEERLLLELKALDSLHPRHGAQVLTYLRLSELPLGLLVNFNAVPLADGIRRFVNARSAT